MPLLATIARNRRAPRAALPVLVLLVHEGLLTADWQRVKLLTVATLTGRHTSQCHHVLGWLTEQRYLERRDEPFVGPLYRVRQEAA